MLRGINKTQKDDAYRLLQCLTVASRPLLVEELAELLAFDFQVSSSGGIPKLRKDWRWDDDEEAVLSSCSSLITIVRNGDSRVVQFLHFSVKEYLTSPRLARSSHADVARFHIDLEQAHTIMAQACLVTLLRRDEHAGKSGASRSPLAKYAAQHWVDHAQVEKVTSRVQDAMKDLFDSSKPHFVAWLRLHDIDEKWTIFSRSSPNRVGSPLYYAAFCGFYDLAERLIMKHPEQVNAHGGRIIAPLPAALYKKHFRVANLLYRRGADLDIQGSGGYTPLHVASTSENVDIMRWLLDRGADAKSRNNIGRTPLHYAASRTRLEVIQVLLEYTADINSQDNVGETPLYEALTYGDSQEGEVLDLVGQLLKHGADTNIPNIWHSTPLHKASSRGWVKVARLLLSYGAKVDEKDVEGRTPFQLATSKGHDEITKLLLEHGAMPQP